MVLNPSLWQAQFGMSPYTMQRTPNVNPMTGAMLGRSEDPRAPLASLYPASAPMAAASRAQPAAVFVTPNARTPERGDQEPVGGAVTVPTRNRYLEGLAQSMMARGASTAPVQSPLEGLARALTGVAGGYFAGQAREAEDARDQARSKAIANLFGLSEAEASALPLEVVGDVAAMRAAEAKSRTEAQKAGFKEERDLRKEFQALSKDFRTQRDAFQRVVSSAEQPTPAGDLALIFNYMKVLDPGSVVRESEFATAASTGAFGERIKGAVERVTSGKRLTDAQRADFVSRASNLYRGAVGGQESREQLYGELAESYGREPERVVTNYVGDIQPLSVEEAISISSGEPLIESPTIGETFRDIAGFGGEGGAELPTPTTQEDYDKIPSGSQYQHPDDPVGTFRTKQ